MPLRISRAPVAIHVGPGIVPCPNCMDLPHLREFLVLADELHFGRAAEKLGIPQSSLSRRMQQLEAMLGVPLIDRSSKAISLTPAGTAFRVEARAYLDGLRDAVAKVRRIAAGHTGQLGVAFPSNLAASLLPQVISRFRQDAPEASLTLRELPTALHETALQSREIDLAVTLLPLRDPTLVQRFLFTEPLRVLLPATHALASHDSVSLRQLAHETFLVCPAYRTAGFHETVLDRCAAFGITPRIGQEIDSRVLLGELVARGDGVAILPESSARANASGVVMRALAEPLEPVRVGLAWSEENNNALRKLFVAAAVACTRTRAGASAVTGSDRPSTGRERVVA